MNKFHTLTVGEKEYKLRLTASSIMSIEKKLGRPLFSALENIQENMIETVVTILWGALQPFNANMGIDQAGALFDEYVDRGHSIEELMQEINLLFESSGFFRKGQAN